VVGTLKIFREELPEAKGAGGPLRRREKESARDGTGGEKEGNEGRKVELTQSDRGRSPFLG